MRPKLQKQSALKHAGRIIPRSGGYDTPQRAAEFIVPIRDFSLTDNFFYSVLPAIILMRFVLKGVE